MALKSLAGFLVSDPVVPRTSYGVLSLPGVKVGDLIVSVPLAEHPVGQDSFVGNVVASYLGIVTTDDEVYQAVALNHDYAPEVIFIILRPGC